MGCLLCVRYRSAFCVCVIWLMLSSTGWRRYHDYIPVIDLETQAQGSSKPLRLQSQHSDSRVLASKCYSILPPSQMFYISGPPRWTKNVRVCSAENSMSVLPDFLYLVTWNLVKCEMYKEPFCSCKIFDLAGLAGPYRPKPKCSIWS